MFDYIQQEDHQSASGVFETLGRYDWAIFQMDIMPFGSNTNVSYDIGLIDSSYYGNKISLINDTWFNLR